MDQESLAQTQQIVRAATEALRTEIVDVTIVTLIHGARILRL